MDCSGLVPDPNAGFACGSVVLFFSFSQKNSHCDFFVKKHGICHPAGGAIPRQTRDRLMHISIGRFAVFAHFVVFVVQTPTT